jgi:hypothetical protein
MIQLSFPKLRLAQLKFEYFLVPVLPLVVDTHKISLSLRISVVLPSPMWDKESAPLRKNKAKAEWTERSSTGERTSISRRLHQPLHRSATVLRSQIRA